MRGLSAQKPLRGLGERPLRGRRPGSVAACVRGLPWNRVATRGSTRGLIFGSRLCRPSFERIMASASLRAGGSYKP